MADSVDGNPEIPNSRVTTREFYIALCAQNTRMEEMERRILEKLEPLPSIATRLDNVEQDIAENKSEIKRLNDKYGIWGAINSLGEAVLVIWAFVKSL